MVDRRSVRCIMCGSTVRMKILANHLENKHSIAPANIKRFCSIQMENETKVLPQSSTPNHVKKSKDKKKDKSEKKKLKKRFQDSIRDQYLNLDVFTKMLMDVSFDYHEKRLSSPGESQQALQSEEVKPLNKTPGGNPDLKIRINLKEKKVMEPKSQKIATEIFHLHQCSHCKETFKSQSILKKHVKLDHSNKQRRSSVKKNMKDKIKNHPIQRLGRNKRSQ